MKDKKAATIYILLTICLWQFIDSISKLILKGQLLQNDPFISIQQIQNNGAAFGIFKDNPYVLGALGIVVLFAAIFYVFKNVKFENKIKILVFSIFSAGILGNTVERLTLGHVVDFIKLKLFDFPIFNLYDVLICTSVFLYILHYIKTEIKKGFKIGNKNK